jgi:type II secretory pathway component PulF
LAIFILPQLVPVFDTLNVDLPPTTRALLWFSDLMQAHGILLMGSMFGFFIIFYFLLKLRPIKTVWDYILLKIPVAGTISKEYQLTVVSQLITTLFQSGLTINDSLDIIADSVTNITYEKAIREIRARVAKGTSLAEALKKHPNLFPGVFISVVATGEETGSYGSSFQYLSNFFANKVTEKTKRLPTLIEPALLIVIGILVAFLAMAIVLPIYDVTKGLY